MPQPGSRRLCAERHIVVLARGPAAKSRSRVSDAILAGMGGFRQRCADCHGTDGKGVRAPDITHVWSSGRTDQGLFRTIRAGIPMTEMPSHPAPRTSDREIWQMLAYLKTLAAPAPSDPPRGNAENGARVFRTHCASCHRVNAAGGRLGPDLSRIGAARSRDVWARIGARVIFRRGSSRSHHGQRCPIPA